MNQVALCACHEVGYEIARRVLAQGLKIDHLITLSPELAQKNKVSGFFDLKPLATEYDIPVYEVQDYSLNHPDDQSFFEEHQFDLLLQGGWQRLFPESVLKTLRVGAVGIHGSSEMLPKGRGRSPINWCLIEGKNKFIIQYFLITPGVDDGPLFHHFEFDLTPQDDVRTVYYKYALVTAQSYLEWTPKLLKGDVRFTPQQGEASYFAKRTPEDGLIDWTKPAKEICDFVRAQTKPYPGAFAKMAGDKITIWQAQHFDSKIKSSHKPGVVVEVFQTGDFLVQTGQDLLLVRDYQSHQKIKEGEVLNEC